MSDWLSSAPDTYSLGSITREWLNLFIGDAGRIYLGLAQDLSIYRSALNTMTLVASAGVAVSSLNLGAFKFSSLIADNKVPDSDLWDGYQFADYLNQAVKTTSSPTLATLNLLSPDTIKLILQDSVAGVHWNVIDWRNSAGTRLWSMGQEETSGDFDLSYVPTALMMKLTTAGQLQLPVTGSSGGLLIGGDFQWYRSAADVGRTPDSIIIDGGLTVGGATILQNNRLYGIKQQAANPVLADLADGEIRFVYTASDRIYVRVNGVLYYVGLTAA